MKSLTLALKDVKLLVRDKSALFWVLVFPLMIAILFGSIFGGSNGASKIDVVLIDQDNSKQSQELVKGLKDSTALNVLAPAQSDALSAAKESVRKGNLSAYILIPKGFGHEVQTFQYAKGPAIQLGIDPSHQAEAGMLQGIATGAASKLMGDAMQMNPQDLAENLSNVQNSTLDPARKKDLMQLMHYASDLQTKRDTDPQASTASFEFEGPQVEQKPISASGSKPASAFEITFPQAIIWGLLGVISSFVVSLVKEREQGTLVRLQSTMSMGEILAGKALACLIACAGVMALLLLIGHFAFNVRLTSPLLLAMAILCGSLCVVGIMMLLSVLGRTEQAVSGSSWGVMITMAMFGGGMIPIFMMPGWMQSASSFSPLKWTVLSIEGAIWRGFTFQEMLVPCAILVAIGAVCFGAGVKVLRSRG
ncbi:MAG TPA: ABC transporter permease [Fimbriimonadaceae bacterium]|jgi:ABC-2 type transport system permease protein